MPAPVTVWNDYICPWAYAARPRTDWLRARGVEVELRFYELHPDIGEAGRSTRPGGRLDQVFDHLAEVCAASGLGFVKPARTPNSHRCLEMMELVRVHHRDHLLALDAAFAAAHWTTGLPLDDGDVLESIVVEGAGRAVAADIGDRIAVGEGRALLEASRDDAHEVGVTATPAWRMGELTVTGLHPSEQFERWATRVLDLP